MLEDLRQLEEAMGYVFTRPELPLQALTHSSLAHERGGGASHNEQLEFLGDAVLGLAVSDRLVDSFPQQPEGRLSKIKAHLVSASHLFSVAERLHLGEYLQLGRGEEKSGGRAKRAVLVNALEALIAALYLDGGLDPARRFVDKLVIGDHLEQGIEGFPFTDFKSALQEHLQSHKRAQPRYLVVEERGPEHRKVFAMEVRVGRQVVARAEGSTKKNAEQAAARAALMHLMEEAAAKQSEAPVRKAEKATRVMRAKASAAEDAGIQNVTDGP
jgi:ribonuclease-3